MNHDRIVELLSEYRDGALPPAERELVAAHLPACESCARALADWDRLAAAFFARPAAPTPVATEAFVARVMARLPDEAPGIWAWLTGRWLTPALGLGLVALIASFLPYLRESSAGPGEELLASASTVVNLYAVNQEDR